MQTQRVTTLAAALMLSITGYSYAQSGPPSTWSQTDRCAILSPAATGPTMRIKPALERGDLLAYAAAEAALAENEVRCASHPGSSSELPSKARAFASAASGYAMAADAANCVGRKGLLARYGGQSTAAALFVEQHYPFALSEPHVAQNLKFARDKHGLHQEGWLQLRLGQEEE